MGGCEGCLIRLRNGLRDDLVERVEHELHKGAGPTALRGLAPERAARGLEVDVAPEPARERGGIEVRVELGVDRGEGGEAEAPVELAARREEVAEKGEM